VDRQTREWMETVQEPTVKDHIDTFSTPVLDPQELHIEQIFAPGRFDVLTILRALNVSCSSIVVVVVVVVAAAAAAAAVEVV